MIHWFVHILQIVEFSGVIAVTTIKNDFPREIV